MSKAKYALLERSIVRLAKAMPSGGFVVRVAKDVIEDHKRVDEKIEAARKEMNDGARPKKGRFRL